MKLLKVIQRKEGLRVDGRTSEREAVRGIILDPPRLLMVHSTHNGDYKFPGGGVLGGESHEEALQREVLEECGATICGSVQPFGKVIEYDLPKEPEYYDVFKMTSYYYLCQVEGALGPQSLEPYERDLGFVPRWVEIEHAIQANTALLRDAPLRAAWWAARELFVLGQIKEQLLPPPY